MINIIIPNNDTILDNFNWQTIINFVQCIIITEKLEEIVESAAVLAQSCMYDFRFPSAINLHFRLQWIACERILVIFQYSILHACIIMGVHPTNSRIAIL